VWRPGRSKRLVEYVNLSTCVGWNGTTEGEEVSKYLKQNRKQLLVLMGEVTVITMEDLRLSVEHYGTGISLRRQRFDVW